MLGAAYGPFSHVTKQNAMLALFKKKYSKSTFLFHHLHMSGSTVWESKSSWFGFPHCWPWLNATSTNGTTPPSQHDGDVAPNSDSIRFFSNKFLKKNSLLCCIIYLITKYKSILLLCLNTNYEKLAMNYFVVWESAGDGECGTVMVRLSTGRSGPALAHFGWPWPWPSYLRARPGQGRPWPLLYLEINFIEYKNAFYK